MFASILSVAHNLGYPALVLLVMSESSGVPLPGETALITAAVLASQHRLHIAVVIALAAAAAIVGDNAGYSGGHRRLGCSTCNRCDDRNPCKWSPLTQTHALARVVVREAAERWAGWWNAELFGVPHREADMALLEELREGLLRKRLVRRRGSMLLATAKGRKLAHNPIALLYELALDLGGGDLFTSMVANVVVDELEENAPCTHDELVARAHEASQRGLA
jgi:hypothetical protein